MPIAIACQHCDWKGKVADTLAGKKGKCPTCGELVPIPQKAAPPPVPARKAVDTEPDVVDDADIVEDDRPSKSRGAAARRRPDDEDDDRPARSRRRADDDDEDDRPSRSRRRPADDDEDEDRPARSRRRDDDDEDERPARSRRRDDDDEDEDRPRKKRGGPRKRRPQKSGMSGKRIGAIVGGVFALLVGGAWLAFYLMSDGGRFRIYPIFLLIGGLIGLFQGMTGAGLGEDDE